MAKRIGVLLSGCGVFDGSEVHEAVLTLLALDLRGAEALICAPDMPQMHVVNHLTGEVDQGATRNVLVESARIARGKIKDVAQVSAADVDGLALPGGFGAAKNLCDFATRGKDCEVHPQVTRLVREVHEAGKPVAAVCIAPALLARILGAQGPRLTIGSDAGTAAALEAMGAVHVSCGADDVVVDHAHRLVTSPAYMLGRHISEVARGIDKAMAALLDMA
jgi:enhancing lycopene biosynthesis protein 2